MNSTPGTNDTTGPSPDPYDATLTTADGRATLRIERALAHPPERVWTALTDPAALGRWFPAEVTLDLAPGGRIVFRFPGAEDGDPRTKGIVMAVDEPRLLAFTWGGDELRWSVAPKGGGALLTLVHTFGDLPGAASFASGWHLCVAALARSLDGEPVPAGRDTGALHEAYLHRFGLDRGTVETLGETGERRIRFERQLVRPAGTVWAALSAGIEPVAGLPVPEGFTADGVTAGPVTEVRAPHSLTYRAEPDTTVVWELRDGTGHGARLVLTQTGPAESVTDALSIAWRNRIERLAAELLRL
ncbi:SRPBCC family protein [Streptomyces paludis]|uniref:Toxin-antitoxin system toxin subunit n=1 Tax=Streptomyces paludis TaxID=2282738 RepID=A0A345HIC7_9ACTN|nr:SRPBCC family protein [Streptomyces paludis]AXG76451.1 toxin-antitoxin system toxin subunit [Streptomyces paludis]